MTLHACVMGGDRGNTLLTALAGVDKQDPGRWGCRNRGAPAHRHRVEGDAPAVDLLLRDTAGPGEGKHGEQARLKTIALRTVLGSKQLGALRPQKKNNRRKWRPQPCPSLERARVSGQDVSEDPCPCCSELYSTAKHQLARPAVSCTLTAKRNVCGRRCWRTTRWGDWEVGC